MTFTQELSSWLTPTKVETASITSSGSQAPASDEIPFPRTDGKPVIVTFLRHCGCPFAEKSLLTLRQMAEAHPDVQCIAVSHSDKPATDKWLASIGGAGAVEVVVDYERKLYGKYGLGVSSAWHVLNPWSMADVFKLAKAEQIKNRPTESGTRWQTAGTFGVDASGTVKYVQVAKQASENGDFDKALEALTKSRI